MCQTLLGFMAIMQNTSPLPDGLWSTERQEHEEYRAPRDTHAHIIIDTGLRAHTWWQWQCTCIPNYREHSSVTAPVAAPPGPSGSLQRIAEHRGNHCVKGQTSLMGNLHLRIPHWPHWSVLGDHESETLLAPSPSFPFTFHRVQTCIVVWRLSLSTPVPPTPGLESA